MNRVKETRSTITLAIVLLLLIALFALDLVVVPFFEGRGLFELATALEALELPLLLGGSMFVIAYASGYLQENLKGVSINAAIFASLFLLGEILVFSLSVFLSLVVFKVDIHSSSLPACSLCPWWVLATACIWWRLPQAPFSD